MSLAFGICAEQSLFFKKISTHLVHSLARINTNNPFHLWQGCALVFVFRPGALNLLHAAPERHWSFFSGDCCGDTCLVILVWFSQGSHSEGPFPR